MNFEYTQEQNAIKKAALDFTVKELAPAAHGDDREPHYPRELVGKLAQLGFLSLSVEKSYGGSGSGLMDMLCLVDGLATGYASVASIAATHLACGKILSRHGSDAVKEKYLKDVAKGSKLVGYAFAEPGAAPASGDKKAVAAPEGEKYVLNGEKTFVLNGGAADLYLVTAQFDAEAGPKGVGMFVVDASDVEVLGDIDKLGLRCFPTARIGLANVKADIVGSEESGPKIIAEAQAIFDILNAAVACGVGRTTLSETATYSNTRIQFGAPIGKIQAVQWMLADIGTDLHYIELGMNKAAAVYDEGGDFITEAAYVKNYAMNASQDIGMKSVQIHGGMGYTRDANIERYFRDIRGAFHLESISDYPQKTIAKNLLK
ncbi:MAG: acyl-CoA dehydrogenase family protein [Clostridiales Family XIII bacterium]|jgi:alkylation response protein AidB-like acyl-CoA dehydrogenase|nr:acyl-CoA dehydrogenase family protein [Clostridiales Family XIII bacterium]